MSGLKVIVAVTMIALASPIHPTSSFNSPASTSNKLTFAFTATKPIVSSKQ